MRRKHPRLWRSSIKSDQVTRYLCVQLISFSYWWPNVFALSVLSSAVLALYSFAVQYPWTLFKRLLVATVIVTARLSIFCLDASDGGVGVGVGRRRLLAFLALPKIRFALSSNTRRHRRLLCTSGPETGPPFLISELGASRWLSRGPTTTSPQTRKPSGCALSSAITFASPRTTIREKSRVEKNI